MASRFTMVELMAVVAICSLLAAIAVPAMAEYQVRAKRAESPINVDGLATVVVAARADGTDGCWTPSQYPPSDPWWDWQPTQATMGKGLRPWTGTISFLDWEPDGRVRGSYVNRGCSPFTEDLGDYRELCQCFNCVVGAMDVDEDGDTDEESWAFALPDSASPGLFPCTAHDHTQNQL